MRIQRWSPPSIDGTRRRRPRPYSCMSGSGPKAANTSSRCAGVSLSSVSSSWLRRNEAHARLVGDRWATAEGADQRPGVASGEGEPRGLHAEEVEQHVQLVAVLVAEEAALLGGREVDLAEQHRLPDPPGEEGPQVTQVVVRVELHGVERALRLEQERDGVDAEAGQALGQPEPEHLADLLAHGRRGDVEVRLVAVEAMQVVLAGLGVVGPHALLAAGEDDAARAVGRAPRRARRRTRGTATRASAARPGTTGAGRTCG